MHAAAGFAESTLTVRADGSFYTATTFTIILAANDFSLRNLTVSAEREDGSTPGARVTWSMSVPPGCVASVWVEFRTSSSGSVAIVTRASTSETEVLQTGLRCSTTYYIRVVVTGVASLLRSTLNSSQVQVQVPGKIALTTASGGEVTAILWVMNPTGS